MISLCEQLFVTRYSFTFIVRMPIGRENTHFKPKQIVRCEDEALTRKLVSGLKGRSCARF